MGARPLRLACVAAAAAATAAGAGCVHRCPEQPDEGVSGVVPVGPAEAAGDAGASTVPAAPDAVLAAFVDHARDGAFETALTLLAEPLRTRYDSARLEADHADAGDLDGLLDAIEAALAAGGTVVSGDEATLPLGGGRAVRLVREDGGWRILALR